MVMQLTCIFIVAHNVPEKKIFALSLYDCNCRTLKHCNVTIQIKLPRNTQ